MPEVADIFRTGKSLREVDAYTSQFVSSIRLLIKKLITDPESQIDNSKIGAFGFSLGAVYAASIIGIDENVTHAYIVGGGGDLGRIASESNQFMIKRLKDDNVARKLVLSEKWADAVRENLSIEPLRFAKLAKNKKIFMVMCAQDQVVPYQSQLDLWNAFNRPPFIRSDYHSHLGTLIKWFMKDAYGLIDFIME